MHGQKGEPTEEKNGSAGGLGPTGLVVEKEMSPKEIGPLRNGLGQKGMW